MNYKFNKDLCSPRMYVEFNSYVQFLLLLLFTTVYFYYPEMK